MRAADNVTLRDEAALCLLLNLEISYGSDLHKSEATYRAETVDRVGEPEFDDLARRGYFHAVWGRIYASYDVARTTEKLTDGTGSALRALLAKRHDETYFVKDAARTRADLVTTVSAIERGEPILHNLPCESPEWVAARLWDRSLSKITDESEELRSWVDRWRLLGSPSLVPGRVWNTNAVKAFRDAALAVLDSEPSLTGWDEMRSRIMKQLSVTGGLPLSDLEVIVPPRPVTLVDSALWLNQPGLERQMAWTLDAYQDLFGLVYLLLEDVRDQQQSAAPNKIAKNLFELALKSPYLLLGLLWRIRSCPILLADLALYPPTSALACLLIAQWPPNPGAWDRELRNRDDQTTKSIAFADAVSVLGHFLEVGSLSPAEAAALLVWLHKTARPDALDVSRASESMLVTLRRELAGQTMETLRQIAAFLMASMPQKGLGTAIFTACLDVIEFGRLSDEIDPAVLVAAYAESISAGGYSVSARGVTAGGAAALLRAVKQKEPEVLKTFLYPIDIKAKLAAGIEENPFTLADTIAQSLRAHIRVLCRAVVGWTDDPIPADVVVALIAAVRAGALKHDEKARVAAFSPRFEANGLGQQLDRPIAADLGAVFGTLIGDDRERLLAAILETDEPMVLAQLLSFAPRALRDRIQGRVAELTPEDGDLRSLTEVQARIDALLSAGLGDAATKFIEAEPGVKTWGNAPGRELTRLLSKLRLSLLRGEWSKIGEAELPPGLSTADRSSAADMIAFFRALSELRRPEGDPKQAERALADLHGRRPDVVAYAVNLFAARISHLLGVDSFSQLMGADAARGRQILSDADKTLLRLPTPTEADLNTFNSNKAVLLLAVGQPEQAYDLLGPIRASGLRDNAESFAAIALARMGRVREAISVLDGAEAEIGITAVLRAARAQIQSGRGFAAAMDISTGEDSSQRVKLALLDLLQMDHMRQAVVLQPPPEPFDAFVISHVRAAAASVTSLVPMMKVVDFTSSEDDLSALVRELLRSRLQFLNWSVPDQSKGGFTAKGNAGERDLLLQKDSTTLAAIEAVVCRTSVSQTNLTYHFKKMLAYDHCRLFFHLTYSFLESPSGILEHLRNTAKNDAPKGFDYLGQEDIPFTDSRPVGIIARYAMDQGEVKVVFLILDIRQQLQRDTAKTAKD
jgi:hypothetical protein